MPMREFFNQYPLGEKVIAAGVSGGADSLALVLRLKEWADAEGCRVVALTVDHRLRKESVEEIKKGAISSFFSKKKSESKKKTEKEMESENKNEIKNENENKSESESESDYQEDSEETKKKPAKPSKSKKATKANKAAKPKKTPKEKKETATKKN